MNYYEVFQGNTSPILYVRPSVLNSGDLIDSNWVCFTNVRDNTGAEVIAKRAITQKANVAFKNANGSTTTEQCFVIYLTGAETATLAVNNNNTHYWSYKLQNTTISPEFIHTEKSQLVVKPQMIA